MPIRATALAAVMTISSVLPSAAEEPRSMTWRGRPLSETRSFWISEFGIGGRLNESGNAARADNLFAEYATLELGPMVNVTSRIAVGGTASLRGSGEAGVGVNARVRWWLDRKWALDLSPGVIIGGSSGDSRYDLTYPSATGRVSLSYGDWVGVTAGSEQIRIHGGASEVDWFAGVYLGSYPGAIVSGLFMVASLLYQPAPAGN